VLVSFHVVLYCIVSAPERKACRKNPRDREGAP